MSPVSNVNLRGVSTDSRSLMCIVLSRQFLHFFQFNALPRSVDGTCDRDIFLGHTISSYGAKKSENLYIIRAPVLDGENVIFVSTLSFIWVTIKIEMTFL